MNDSRSWAKARYLDASSLVKVFVDEEHSAQVRDFYRSRTSLVATSLCVGEALGAIKAKHTRKHIDAETYFAATRRLISDCWGRKLEVDSVDLFTPEGQATVEAAARRHRLDLSDALQLVTILQGRYSHLGPNSRTWLVTADVGLTRAARSEGVLVWNCAECDAPAES